MHRGAICCVLLFLNGCSRLSSKTVETNASDVLLALADSIRGGGAATVVVPPPVRSYQRQPMPHVQRSLAGMLALPASDSAQLPMCKWAGASVSSGMAISVTRLDVVGDSALVSVLRACRAPSRGGSRMGQFEFEPTWILRRSGGRWVVTRTRIRIT